MLARSAHRAAEADSLITELARRDPGSVEVQLVAAQSLVTDRRDPRAALAALDRIVVPDSEPFTKLRVAFTRADAYVAAGMKDSARAVLAKLAAENPGNPRIRQRLERLQ
jgi:predicted Zn-dependent protease